MISNDIQWYYDHFFKRNNVDEDLPPSCSVLCTNESSNESSTSSYSSKFRKSASICSSAWHCVHRCHVPKLEWQWLLLGTFPQNHDLEETTNRKNIPSWWWNLFYLSNRSMNSFATVPLFALLQLLGSSFRFACAATPSIGGANRFLALYNIHQKLHNQDGYKWVILVILQNSRIHCKNKILRKYMIHQYMYYCYSCSYDKQMDWSTLFTSDVPYLLFQARALGGVQGSLQPSDIGWPLNEWIMNGLWMVIITW